MRCLSSLLVCVAVGAQLLLVPWQHVHAHGHSAHHAESGWHAHQVQEPAGVTWTAHGPDEDARSLSLLPGTVQVSGHASLAVLTSVKVPACPTSVGSPPGTFVSRGHDPPGPPPRSPRAPPVPASSLA